MLLFAIHLAACGDVPPPAGSDLPRQTDREVDRLIDELEPQGPRS